jgi:uncharacterized pyridoxal phosphate-dependent enzyme
VSVYESIGLKPIINANATLTVLGGSLMPPEVINAMQEASLSFVDLHDMQRRVGDRIAALTNNEAAYVTSGAAAGLYLSALACGLTTDPADGVSLNDRDKNEVIVHRSHQNPYLPSVELAGARLVFVGSEDGADAEELRQTITSRTVAVLFLGGSRFAAGALPLEEVVHIAHESAVPVIVDAAAQLPPPDNLWRFTGDFGADLAIFSGGKGLRGPQSSGVILGRRELIEVCRVHGAPNQLRGRPMKVGKEEMAGLLVAVERFLNLDHEALAGQYEAMVRTVIEAASEFPDVNATRDWPSEAGQPIPRARVTVGSGALQLQEDLLQGEPRISVALDGDEALLINPETLNPGEEIIVAERLLMELERRTGR